MKSLIVSTLDFKGGAAKAAYRVHSSLLNTADVNVNSYMYVQAKGKSDENILYPENWQAKLTWKTKCFIASKFMYLQRSRNNSMHSPAFLPCNLHKFINKSNFDIINLHWIQGEMLSIESIGKIKKPLIWTLHDSWAFSGSEHYPSDLFKIDIWLNP